MPATRPWKGLAYALPGLRGAWPLAFAGGGRLRALGRPCGPPCRACTSRPAGAGLQRVTPERDPRGRPRCLRHRPTGDRFAGGQPSLAAPWRSGLTTSRSARPDAKPGCPPATRLGARLRPDRAFARPGPLRGPGSSGKTRRLPTRAVRPGPHQAAPGPGSLQPAHAPSFAPPTAPAPAEPGPLRGPGSFVGPGAAAPAAARWRLGCAPPGPRPPGPQAALACGLDLAAPAAALSSLPTPGGEFAEVDHLGRQGHGRVTQLGFPRPLTLTVRLLLLGVRHGRARDRATPLWGWAWADFVLRFHMYHFLGVLR